MQIRVDHLTPCCGDQPSLDTWDKNEARSVRCMHCGRHTESHFEREFAYDEWQKMMRVTGKIVKIERLTIP